MKKQIIVNADDFGINDVVTSEIERMILLGVVSSTTVMANGTCLEEVRRFSIEHPEASYGVHLCLSEFDSITKSEGLHIAGITDEKGRFVHKAIFRLQSCEDKDVQKAIRDELNAQIDVISSLGFPISHADSHHHVHTIYPLREVFAEVLQERGIKKVRLGCDFCSWRMRLHVQLWLKRNRLNRFYREGFITANKFYSYADFVRDGLPIKDGETIELMCHPGHPGQKYRDEMKLVESKASIGNKNIKMITYNEL